MKKILIYLTGILLALFIGIVGTKYYLTNNTNNETTTIKEVNINESNTLKESIDKIYDAVVVVQTYDEKNNIIGTGTGFVYKKTDDKGYIITNHHVIDKASIIKIINTNNQEVGATLNGSDEYSDIAILTIPIENVLKVATIGDSTKLELGDTLFTVGSPLGIKYQGTVTKGILSGKDRKVTVNLNNGSFVMDVLQTDAAINPGNSGGPLVNINGEVIGVTSMKLVEDEIEGMGFAIPIEMVMATIDDLESGKKIERPILGVNLINIDEYQILRSYNITIDDNIKKGIVIVKVENNTPAYGILEKGDVIVKINDEEVEDTAHFKYMLYKYRVGDTITLTYYRNNKLENTKILLDKGL